MEENLIDLARLKELTKLLTQASKAYYAENSEIMTDFEYDRLYDELVALEEKTGIQLADSPTINVGYQAVEELPKEKHEKPMLSLGKTKDRQELKNWLNKNQGLLSWKLDGLTVVLTYRDGKLAKAVTRGNGEVGEVVTNNASVFKNIPLSIAFKGELILRGEAVISYADFDKINEQIPETDAKYKNPRNLCSGSVRQLNNQITASRNVRFYAFTLVKADEVDFKNSRKAQYDFLSGLGFEVVPYKIVTESNILETIEEFAKEIAAFQIPSDGLVLILEDIAYGLSLGVTAKFPRNAIAFKWSDETSETILEEIEWSPSRTGLINPVAIFRPVELEGTTVSRASVHNLSVMRNLKLGIGDHITVYKANMIIPQIAENLTGSNNVEIPKLCPACGGETRISQTNDVQSLYCINELCPAKKIKSFSLFVSRDALNIDGMSEATLEKFIGMGFIHSFKDIFHLDEYREAIIEMEGFGEKSYNNLIESIEKARNTNLYRLIYGLGIENIGIANAKMICRYYDEDIEKLRNAPKEDLSQIEGVGEVIAGTFSEYFKEPVNAARLDELLKELYIIKEERNLENQNLSGMTFVITGSLEHYDNRDALKDIIESRGGKVSASVSAKTRALINNDITSVSGKNKKAKELNIPVLTEKDFEEAYLQ